MISSPKNPILKNLIQNIIENKNNYKYDYEKIQKTTGPIFINNFLGKYIDNNNFKDYYINIFEHYYFEQYSLFGLCEINENTLAIHKMEMSWISNNIKFFIKSYYNVKNNFGTVIVIIIFICFVFIYLKKMILFLKIKEKIKSND